MASAPSHILGIDLAGPANATDTALAWFEDVGDVLVYRGHRHGADDAAIVGVARPLQGLVTGIDAPLSYQDGGGDRPSDRALRERVIAHGMRGGSVMAPTFTRMSFLTLRGLGVARLLTGLGALVEVHPGAAMATHGAPLGEVLAYKGAGRSASLARRRLIAWLGEAGLRGLPASITAVSHVVDACAAAFAAWNWKRRDTRPTWTFPAVPPHHPFDLSC